MEYDIIIVGAGISGLTAGIYAARGNAKTLILEKNTFGGQIIEAKEVENYPGFLNISGYDLLEKIYNQALNLGCEVKFEEVVDVPDLHTVITNNETYKTKTIIIANGLSKRKLNIPGEEEHIGKGVSYCATCDGAFYKNKNVAVIGGGNKAIEEALYLSNIAKKVYVIHRNKNLKCEKMMLEKLKSKNNVEFIFNRNVSTIMGNDKVECIVLDNDDKVIVDGVFVSIGNVPNNLVFKNVANLDSNGYINNIDTLTEHPNVFACGDTRLKEYRQLITAASDGAIAAINALKYLQK